MTEPYQDGDLVWTWRPAPGFAPLATQERVLATVCGTSYAHQRGAILVQFVDGQTAPRSPVVLTRVSALERLALMGKKAGL